MENKIKTFYSQFTGGKTITDHNYIITKSHFNSILRDRFLIELNKMGINWDGNDTTIEKLLNISNTSSLSITNKIITQSDKTIENKNSVGIDLQFIDELPDTSDYWEDQFYKIKFTNREIGYCVKKQNPKESFAGLYSIKESLLKCNNYLKWEDIEIVYDDNGKPIYNGYLISISHSDNYVVSVAFFLMNSTPQIQQKSITDGFPNTIASKITSINEISSNNLQKKINLFLLIINIVIILYLFYIRIVN
jgi:phosphopantetheinyl transferase (holo-ACP synthase)